MFDDFLKAYVNHFEFKSICAEDFFNYYCQYFKNKDLLSDEKINELLYKTGLQSFIPNTDDCKVLTDEADKVVELWKEKEEKMEVKYTESYKSWVTQLKIYFIDKIEKLVFKNPKNVLPLLENYYKFSEANSEIKMLWCLIIVKYEYEEYYDVVRKFLKGIGRGKFVFPIHQAMADNPKTRKMGLEIYNETKTMLHAIIINKLNKIYNL